MIHCIGTVRPNLHLKNGLRARSANPLHRNPNARKTLRKAPVVDGQIDKIAIPLWGKFHAALKSSVILRRVLCAEGPLPLGRQNGRTEEFSRAPPFDWPLATDHYTHCPKNLTSPCKNNCKSSTPYFNKAIRPAPIPQATPETLFCSY